MTTSRARRAVLIVLVAIAGLALAVALAVLTSHLTSQPVGLAGEPSRPDSGLVAPARPAPANTNTVTTAPPASTPTTTPSHDGETEHGDD